jgi:hypothetical protein
MERIGASRTVADLDLSYGIHFAVGKETVGSEEAANIAQLFIIASERISSFEENLYPTELTILGNMNGSSYS